MAVNIDENIFRLTYVELEGNLLLNHDIQCSWCVSTRCQEESLQNKIWRLILEAFRVYEANKIVLLLRRDPSQNSILRLIGTPSAI